MWTFRSRWGRPVRRGRARASSAAWASEGLLEIENSHLGWGSDFGVFDTHRQELDEVTESLRNRLRPRAELLARPFEAVVLVAEVARRERGEADVVLDVGRR